MKFFININEYGKITDIIKASRMGELGDRFESEHKVKAVWDSCFHVYEESESIKASLENDEMSPWFPLYSGIGSDDEDYIFASREEALKEYESQIGEEVYCWQYDC